MGGDVSEKLRPFTDKYQRIAFKPIVTRGQGAADGSRFNGAPFLASGEAWPECTPCAQPMAMFVQLNLQTLPAPYSTKFGTGLLQLFYCTREHHHTQTDQWAAFDDKAKLARIISSAAAGAIALPRDVGFKADACAITHWQPTPEAPNWEEAGEYGLDHVFDRHGSKPKTKYVCSALNIDTGWLND